MSDPKAPRPFDTERVAAALAALSALPGRPAPTDDDERPVFLLATSWRSGSTLLQRILVTDPSLIVWGEPFGRMDLLSRVTEAICAVSADWPRSADFLTDPKTGDVPLFSRWIANAFPPVSSLHSALRQLVLQWLAVPAREQGYARWGLKETRLGASDAMVLRWLFPKAHFIALVRSPYDSYRSVRASLRRRGVLQDRADTLQSDHPRRGAPFWARWPDRAVQSAEGFARHWYDLTESWMSAPSDLSHDLVKYEDLISGHFDFRKLEQGLALSLSEAPALAETVGPKTTEDDPLPEEDREIISKTVGHLATKLGYE